MSVGHGDDYNCFIIDTVNKCIGKVNEETSSDLWLQLRRSMWISHNESNSSVERVEELQTFSFQSFFKPNDSIINFMLSEREESDVHLLLYLLSNSSYERVAMFPAL